MFYVGNHGKFDRIALGTLRSLKKKYPHIRYAMVLAYLPKKERWEETPTLYLEEMAKIPRRYAIARRNEWMVEMSGYVIAYVKCNVGGAARYKTLAEKKGKTVLNLVQLMK